MDKRCLTPDQFKKVMYFVWEYHRFGGLSGKGKAKLPFIKYISPRFDMRDGSIFHIHFDDVQFCFDESEHTMYERITRWLGTDEYTDMD